MPPPAAPPSPAGNLPAPAPATHPFSSYNAYDPDFRAGSQDFLGSVYIPVDNWIYPELTRLYELGYLDDLFLAQRPWTRLAVLHGLQDAQDDIMDGESDEAKGILAAALDELSNEEESSNHRRGAVFGVQSAYTRMLGIDGPVLRDSYHLGQTIAQDYGRPYQQGFNNIAGLSTIAEAGRFSLYIRAEYQHSPGAPGYSQTLANDLSIMDTIGPYAVPNAPQATIPAGPIAAQNPGRIMEATLSYHLLGHEISGGKSDAWLGPGMGSAMAWSNNAENIYSFRINRVEPLYIPFASKVLGPIRYDFFYGSLKGHTAPNSPYVHSESLSIHPLSGLQFGFERTIIFGGEGHEPVTLHTFLRGFFSTSNTTASQKLSRNDPGARFSNFNFTWRLPFLERYLTLYADSIVHDGSTPLEAPRRASYRTGVDLSQIPGARKLELRVEAVNTDPGVRPSSGGSFNYFETIQKQGYTNKGFIMGDWIGREAKGGQAWLTYHLAPKEWIQIEYLNKKTPKDFIPGGTTQNQFKASVVKRFDRDFELNAWVQYEGWKAPAYLSGLQKDTAIAVQLTWFPKLKTSDLKHF